MSFLRRALEEIADGKTIVETERVIYGKMVDFSQLANAASKEHQEQHEIKIPKTDNNIASGRIRVRKTIPNIVDIDKVEYVNTTKIKVANGEKETPVPTTVDAFNQYKLLAESGMRKDRYFYPIAGTDLVWEVDCFYKPDAKIGDNDYYEYVKIDLEYKIDPEINILTIELPELPITLEQVISAPWRLQTDEEKVIIQQLYNTMFIMKKTNG